MEPDLPEDTPGWTLIGGSLMLVLWTACDLAGLTESNRTPTGRWEGGDDRAHLTLDLEEHAGRLEGRFSARISRYGSREDLTYEGPVEGRVDARSRVELRFEREERPEERFLGLLIGEDVAMGGTWLSTQGAFDLTLRPKTDGE